MTRPGDAPFDGGVGAAFKKRRARHIGEKGAVEAAVLQEPRQIKIEAGRAVGILVADGSDGTKIKQLASAIQKAGADVKVIAPKITVALNDGSKLLADAQLAGAPSVIFDAVALIVSDEGCASLMKDSAARDFVSNAFVHLKAIGYTGQAKPLLDKVGVEEDKGVVELGEIKGFLKQASTRQWDREPKVRLLA